MTTALRFLFRYKDCDCGSPHDLELSRCFTDCRCENLGCEHRSYIIFEKSKFCLQKMEIINLDSRKFIVMLCKTRDGTRFGAHCFVIDASEIIGVENEDAVIRMMTNYNYQTSNIGEIDERYRFDPEILRRYPLRKNRGKQIKWG